MAGCTSETREGNWSELRMSLCDRASLPKTTGKRFCPEYGAESLEEL